MRPGFVDRPRRRLWASAAALALAAAMVATVRTAGGQPVAAPAGAPGTVLTVVGRPSAEVAAEAGHPITIAAVLANSSPRALTITPAVVGVPDRWRVVTGTSQIVIPAHGRTTWVASIAVPSGAEAGTYVLHAAFALEGAALESPLLEPMSVTVAEQQAVALRVVEPFVAIVAGEGARTQLRVENRGNTRGTIHISSIARLLPSDGVAVLLDVWPKTVDLRLEPGASQVVTLGVHPSSTISRVTPLSLEVQATMGGQRHGDEGSASETLRTIVVPDAVAADEWFSYLPARATLRAGGRGSGLPVEIVGAGTIGGATAPGAAFQGTAVDVVIRGVQNPFSASRPVSMFGERSEYRLGIQTRRSRLTLGDQVVSLTPLTEQGRYGFGVSGAARRGPVMVQGLTSPDGSSWSPVQATGAGVSVRAPAGVEVGAFGLQRSGREGGRIATTRLTARPDSNVRFLLEVGAGQRAATEEAGKSPFARAELAELNLERSSGALMARHVRRATGYPGERQGTEENALNGRYRLGSALRIEGRATQGVVAGGTATAEVLQSGTLGSDSIASSALLTDTVRITLPSERRTDGEMGLYLGDRIGVAFAVAQRVGTSGGLSYDGTEQRVRLQTAGRIGQIHLTAVGELGTLIDRMRQTSGIIRRFSSVASMQIGSHTWASGYADVRQGPTLWSGPATTMNVGVDSRIEIGAMWSARLSASASDQRSLLDGLVPIASRAVMTQVDASVIRALPNGRTLTLRVRDASFRGAYGTVVTQGSRGVAVEYGMPLRLPAWRASRTTQVTGRIVDHETGKGIPRALVQLDDNPNAIAMSDAHGRVRFPGADPGVHRLTLLDGQATAGRVAANPTTLLVAATTERSARDETVALVHGGRLRGAVCRSTDDELTRDMLRRASAAAENNAPSAVVATDLLTPAAVEAPRSETAEENSASSASSAVTCRQGVGVSDALVTLRGPSDTIQVVTDARGTFAAVGLRPGRWEVRVASAQLPDGLAFPVAANVVDLTAGGDATALLRAVPRTKTFRQLRVSEVPDAPSRKAASGRGNDQ